jgi:hypothetical protein
MPTLQRRNDGGFFIRNFHRDDHHTWQVRADGVRFLERRGVREGSFFDTALMMQLYVNGWIYTGAGSVAPRRSSTQTIPPALLTAVRALHSALVSRDAHVAVQYVASSEASRETVFAELSSGIGIRSWKAVDAVVLPLPEPTVRGTGLREAAIVTMRLSSGAGAELVEEVWVRSEGWKALWPSLATIAELSTSQCGAAL